MWLLDMRKKISDSKEAHAATEARINGLHSGMKQLGSNIAAMAPPVCVEPEDSNKLTKSWVRRFHFLHLPPDMLCFILRFLDISQVMFVEMTNSNMPSIIQSSDFWYASYSDEYTNFALSESKNFRDFIVNKARSTSNCLRFIQLMKEQRCVPRFRNIEPHRYSLSERNVSHPMPVFEHTSSSRMMSRAETMNKDFRSYALNSLYTMNVLTSNELDPVHHRLYDSGVVTVLLSLLSNEAGVLQQLSCEILANILCAESRLLYNCEKIASRYCKGIEGAHSVGGAALASMGERTATRRVSIADQLQACDGRRLLLTLLTSPSASVNLAQSRSRAVAVEPCTGPVTAATSPESAAVPGTMHIRTTSAVQGMACRSASRALVNLFSPICVPSPARDKFLRGDANLFSKG